MSTEIKAPDAQTSGTNRRVSTISDSVTSPPPVTVTFGRDGRCSITFGLPAPETPEPEPVDNRPSWLKTMRKGSGPRWKNNRKSAGFILPELFQGLELWSWRALFITAAIIHFIHH